MSPTTNISEEPLMTIGVIADVQHADIENNYNYHKTYMRFYRHAIEKFKEAVKVWNESKVDFSIQLGDVLDGFSVKHGCRDNDLLNITDVIQQFKSVGLPVQRTPSGVYTALAEDAPEDAKAPYMCHLWGNHEFYNYTRAELWRSELNSFVVSPDATTTATSLDEMNDHQLNADFGYYYLFTHKGFRFLALDPYDIGKISRADGSDSHTRAVNTLLKHKNDKEKTHVVSWNGALSNAQLTWLHNELAAATQAGEKVIILSHVPLDARASRPASIIWNQAEVLRMINCFECVVACLAGHYHEGGYYHDKKNRIHHLTFQGVIERDPATNAFAVLELYSDHIKVDGYGKIKSRILKF